MEIGGKNSLKALKFKVYTPEYRKRKFLKKGDVYNLEGGGWGQYEKSGQKKRNEAPVVGTGNAEKKGAPEKKEKKSTRRGGYKKKRNLNKPSAIQNLQGFWLPLQFEDRSCRLKTGETSLVNKSLIVGN